MRIIIENGTGGLHRVDSVEKVGIFAENVFFQGKLVFISPVFNVVFDKYSLRVNICGLFDALFKFRAQIC